MRIKIANILIFLGVVVFGYAQNFHYDYRMVRMDSTFDKNINPKLQHYVDKQKAQIDKVMSEVIGHCDKTLAGFAPESPLSNFITDMLLEQAPARTTNPDYAHCDLAVINFGGMRTTFEAGDITIGDVMSVFPFSNTLTFLEIKGSELRKAVRNFERKAAFSGATITYRGSQPNDIKIQGKALDNNAIYKIVTVNFVAEGGDNIFKDIRFESRQNTEVIIYDFIIDEIKKITASGKSITGKTDGRVKILPQP